MGNKLTILLSESESDTTEVLSPPQNHQSRPPSPSITEFKLLLLSPGSCGKSTLFKQLRVLYGDFSSEEIALYQKFMIGSILQTITSIIEYFTAHQLAFENEENVQIFQVDVFKNYNADAFLMAPKYIDAIKKYAKPIWNDGIVQKHMEIIKIEKHLPDGIETFFADVDEICGENYTLKNKHLFALGIKTIGIIEYDLEDSSNIKWKVVDTGGQRNERAKWKHVIPNTNMIIFLVALNDYCRLCYEDNKTNRMQENLDLFEEITKAEWATNKPILLILNKVDTLEKTLKLFPIISYYGDYKGEANNPKEVVEYIHKKFLKVAKNPKIVHAYAMSCTDTEQVKCLLEDATKKAMQLHRPHSEIYNSSNKVMFLSN